MRRLLIVLLPLLASCFISGCAAVRENATAQSSSTAENNDTLHVTPTPLSEKDLARRAELEGRMLKGEMLHDGSLELYEIGDINSVPALLVVLKENPPNSKGIMVCTAAHALQTLRKVTGANPGFTYDAWLAWWENHKKENGSEIR